MQKVCRSKNCDLKVNFSIEELFALRIKKPPSQMGHLAHLVVPQNKREQTTVLCSCDRWEDIWCEGSLNPYATEGSSSVFKVALSLLFWHRDGIVPSGINILYIILQFYLMYVTHSAFASLIVIIGMVRSHPSDIYSFNCGSASYFDGTISVDSGNIIGTCSWHCHLS